MFARHGWNKGGLVMCSQHSRTELSTHDMSIRICFRIHFATVTILQPTTLYPISPHSNVHSTRPVCNPASARSHRISAENSLLNLSTIKLKGFVCLSHVTTAMLQQKNDGSPILVVVATTPPQKVKSQLSVIYLHASQLPCCSCQSTGTK
jgi:hypothetical protein